MFVPVGEAKRSGTSISIGRSSRSMLPTIAMVWICSLSLLTSAPAQTANYERPPIDYLNAPVNDPVAKLAKRMDSGEVKLEHDEQFGYLKSLLAALDVPLSSQALVFSKTSLQLHRINPRRPRALYFGDDVYIGYCQQGEVLEVAATDAGQGATFYTLSQIKSDRPVFVRDKGGCLICHASHRTQGVPGYLVRSVFPDLAGHPKLGSGTYTTDDTSDFQERWGGWYVSGRHGEMRHMGNTICREDERTFDRDAGANDVDLRDNFPTDPYLTPHSDIVALMVLEHQTQMHNAIAAANYETRMALHQSFEMNELLDRPEGFVSESAQRRIRSSAEGVLRHLLFCDEFQLTDRVSGTTDFAEQFAARGKRDSRGRSLREFDLQQRLFRYPCSYLIHSDAFAGLPDRVRTEILSRLSSILDGRDESGEFLHLTPTLRHEIKSILIETLPEFRRFVSNA